MNKLEYGILQQRNKVCFLLVIGFNSFDLLDVDDVVIVVLLSVNDVIVVGDCCCLYDTINTKLKVNEKRNIMKHIIVIIILYRLI